ncbi:uncharacterized protein LOC116606012 [Nematostella vectensis]|uniref:uncharacterized protein LOC116606012 n=1 Tax=Nematostella vectensis TaxID=45351 RepID=UPI002077852D|nr:uncharacterized protein LOC116606012 [Nematostella vectensis]
MNVIIGTFAFVCLSLPLYLGEARSLVRRDVPPIALPVNLSAKYNLTTTAIPVTTATTTTTPETSKDKSSKKDSDVKIVHESHPNPPVPTPPNFSKDEMTLKPEATVKPEVTLKQETTIQATTATTARRSDMTTKPSKDAKKQVEEYGFSDKYLASQNRFAVRRNVIFDVVGGDSMAFSNYNVLSKQEISFPEN